MTTMTCDMCGINITTVCSGFDVYRWRLIPELVHNTSPTHYLVVQITPKGGEFCSLACLVNSVRADGEVNAP